MENMIALFSVSILFGGMVFFAAVMAPLVFTRLPAQQAGTFIRTVFPVYYLYLLIISAIATLVLLPRWDGVGMAAVAVLTLWLRQWLMPKINAASDAARAGDVRSKTWFDRAHRLSVILNFVQIIAVGIVLSRFIG